MSKSKLQELICSLETLEIRGLKSYLSQNTDNHKTLIRAVDLVYKKKGIDEPFSKEAFFNIFYPNQKYDDTKLRLAQSALFKSSEQFLGIQLLTGDELSCLYLDAFLLNYYRKNQLPKLYKTQMSKLTKALSAEKNLGNQLLRVRQDVQINAFQHSLSVKRKQSLNIDEIITSIDHIYYANKLKFVCKALSHQAVFDQEFSFDDLHWILAEIERKGLIHHPLIGSYFHAYRMLANPDELNLFEHFVAFITQHGEKLENSDQQSLYYFAINQCIRKLNNGDKDFGLKGLELYTEGLDKGILLLDGYLSRFSYRNIAMMAIRSDQLSWAEDFSHKYADALKKGDRKSAYQMNLALVNYHKGEYENALEHIQNADFSDHLIHLAAKVLQAKIYYEMDADTALFSLLDSMDIYLIRNKIIGYHRNNYKNIIKYFKRVAKLNPYDKDKKANLIGRINEESILTEKKWLLEKLQ